MFKVLMSSEEHGLEEFNYETVKEAHAGYKRLLKSAMKHGRKDKVQRRLFVCLAGATIGGGKAEEWGAVPVPKRPVSREKLVLDGLKDFVDGVRKANLPRYWVVRGEGRRGGILGVYPLARFSGHDAVYAEHRKEPSHFNVTVKNGNSLTRAEKAALKACLMEKQE